MFDFPNPPITTGTVVTTPSGGSLQWDGSKWGPVTSGIWVDAPADGTTYGRRNNAWSSVNALVTPALGNVGRNLLHNSMMNINQRNSGPYTANGIYTLDRWYLQKGADTTSITQQPLGDPDRSQIGDEAAKMGMRNIFTGTSAAGDYIYISQWIEDVRRLAGKTVTISFWAWGSASQKLGVSIIQSMGAGGSPSANVTVPGQAVTIGSPWARYSVTLAIPNLQGKMLGNSGDCTGIIIWFSSGANNNATTGNIGVQSGTVWLWGTQVEIGTQMTPFEKIDPRIDLSNCQRFFVAFSDRSWWFYGAAGYGPLDNYVLPVRMRAAPSLVWGWSNLSNATGAAVYGVQPDWFQLTASVVATGQAGVRWTGLSASADL